MSAPRLVQASLRVGVMVAVWLALWSEVSVANVASGTVVAVAVVAAFEPWPEGSPVLRPLRLLRFGWWFLRALVLSNLAVARTVLQPRHRVHTGIVAIPLEGCSDAVVTLIADAVTLTPGTLTLEVRRDPLVLYVHALDSRGLDAIRADLRELEVLAVRAFGDSGAQAGLAVDDTEVWRPR